MLAGRSTSVMVTTTWAHAVEGYVLRKVRKKQESIRGEEAHTRHVRHFTLTLMATSAALSDSEGSFSQAGLYRPRNTRSSDEKK